MAETLEIDLTKVPLVALRTKSRCLLSQMLNACKVIPSPSGYPRDWRGLADLANVPTPPCNAPDPTGKVICHWEKGKATFDDLQSALREIDRWDVLDDSSQSICEDAREYMRKVDSGADLTLAANLELDHHILTVDDIRRLENGLTPQNYDAFLLYSDEDTEFAMKIADKLENEYNLKLCYKDRDLVGGVSFEHEAIMRLISQRCNRLIIVVSEHFFNSPANKFFVAYAQALGIEQRTRKIVPCIYQRFTLPPELSYYFTLDYTRASQLWNFWDKLSQSVTAPVVKIRQQHLPAPPCLKQIKWTGEDEKEEGAVGLPPQSWGCPEKTTCVSADMSELRLSGNQEQKRSKSPTVSLLKKLLPSPPSGKPGSKTWFKKKKKISVTTS